LRKTLAIVTVASFILIAVFPAITAERLKTAEKMELERYYSSGLVKHALNKSLENPNGSVNIVDFGKIIKTEVKWFLFRFLPDTYVIEKHIGVYDWDPDCDEWHIKMSAEPFGSRRLEYVLYTVNVEIGDISDEKEVLVGSEGAEFSFPMTLEDLEKDDIVNVSIMVYGSIILPILRVPRYRDTHPKNNVGICSFILADITPPSIQITKPEKAIYIKNYRILPFFTPFIIGDIDIKVNASDTESGMDRVEFYIDDNLKATDTTTPYIWFWDEKTFLRLLRHRNTIRIVAYDNAGNNNSEEILVRRFF
jgi:hypothetical protein